MQKRYIYVICQALIQGFFPYNFGFIISVSDHVNGQKSECNFAFCANYLAHYK